VLRAILQPAEREGTIRFDSELAHQLVHDMKRPFAFGLSGSVVEPGLLQLVCRRLWAEATSRAMPSATVQMYDELGGADMIVREFVWNELGSAGMEDKEISDPDRPKPRFSAADRVLWSGLTRHLIVSQGVKSIVSPESLCKSLLVEDMGVAGRAVSEQEVSWATAYLDTAPEKRESPPAELVSWIEAVLEAAVDVGFMKRQRRLLDETAEIIPEVVDTNPEDGDYDAATLAGGVDGAEFADEADEILRAEELPDEDGDEQNDGEGEERAPNDGPRLPPSGKYIYELSHDALADILQVFKIEFEGWIRTKAAKLIGILFGAFVVLPILLIAIAVFSAADLASLLFMVIIGAGAGVLYVAVMWVIAQVFRFIGQLIMHPIYRRLARGRVPIDRIRRNR
jgi:hypothetical protein